MININKIKVFLPKELWKKNIGKEFQYLEINPFFSSNELLNGNDAINEIERITHDHRVILFYNIENDGYCYKVYNFKINDLKEEEFDEFLKIFNLQGSCTSKISLCG